MRFLKFNVGMRVKAKTGGRQRSEWQGGKERRDTWRAYALKENQRGLGRGRGKKYRFSFANEEGSGTLGQ